MPWQNMHLVSECAEDSVEIALEFFKSVGAYLQDVNLGGYNMCSPACRLAVCRCTCVTA